MFSLRLITKKSIKNVACYSTHYSGMKNGGVSNVPIAVNEEIRLHSPGSEQFQSLKHEAERISTNLQQPFDIPIIINGTEIRTGNVKEIRSPQKKEVVLGRYHLAGEDEVRHAISSALSARAHWRSMPVQSRLGIFLKMAELLAGPYRNKINAATMIGQGKNALQAEIDAACETIDFLNFNVQYAEQIYQQQPLSPRGQWNRAEYRALEGFVYAISPFNFTAIACNLATAPAMLGNTVVWKPSDSAIISNFYLMELYKEAGLPDGVINFVPGDPVEVTKVVLDNPDLSGVHFTGSTAAFKSIWQKVASNLDVYKDYPRIVGETGGKDYIFAHPTADVDKFVTGIIRGGFEYSGQKCSACSRAYVPQSLWGEVKEKLQSTLKTIKTGDPIDPHTFVGPVIHQAAFDRVTQAIEDAKKDESCTVIAGGTYDDTVGYFIQPTVIQTTDPNSRFLKEEFFGPLVAIYVYEDSKLDAALAYCEDSKYALTGAIFAKGRSAIEYMMDRLPYSAGNFYINDKCTGSVVGQQPFGGSRQSGTNDKAGSSSNLLRWLSAKSIKETFNAPTNPLYPGMK